MRKTIARHRISIRWERIMIWGRSGKVQASQTEEARADGVRAISLSPGTVATDMQAAIRDSGVNPISQLDWTVHIPPEWPARALLWMCGPDADAFLGAEISLRDEAIRRRVGLIS